MYGQTFSVPLAPPPPRHRLTKKPSKVNGERKLYKENKEVSTLPVKEATLQFLAFVLFSGKIELSPEQTTRGVPSSLHFSYTDVPALLRISKSDFKEQLQAVNVFRRLFHIV